MSHPSLLPDDVHDQALLEAVHPSGHVNPEPDGRYNLVVVGGGTAGLVSAAIAAGLGGKVALVERQLMGGDCLNVGCVPSKGLIAAARKLAEVREAGRFGVRVPDGVTVDFSAVMERMRRLRAGIAPNDSVARFQEKGVEVFLGEGRFTGHDSLEVDGRTLRFAKAVIATGGRASAPPIAGLDQVPYLTNETLFSLTELPLRLVVLGAGPIGCEMAQSFARFGSRVTLVELGPHVLMREDPDAAAIVQGALERDGVEVLAGAATERVLQRDGETVVRLAIDGQTREVAGGALLVAVGRRPNVDGLGLEHAGVVYDERRGVQVDDRLRTTNRDIFAAGDVCSRHQFTHTADFQARLVVRNALFGGRSKVSDLVVPWVTYTDPEVAHVGLYEHEAAEQGLEVDTYVQPLDDVDRALLDGETEGFVKVHVARGGDTLLGATIVARHAGEMIGELTLAQRAGVGLGTVADTIHPYPTQAEAIRRTGDQYSRTRLTPGVAKWMARWLAFTRRG